MVKDWPACTLMQLIDSLKAQWSDKPTSALKENHCRRP
jgi:hypothetical protein